MCLSSVYTIDHETETLVCKLVSQMSVKDDIIALTDIMGSTIEITGKLVSIDLINNTVKIRVA